MAELFKGTTLRLRLSPDGRQAENWNSYALFIENRVSGLEFKGLDLDEVLLNTGDGAKPEDPGVVATWLAKAWESAVLRATISRQAGVGSADTATQFECMP